MASDFAQELLSRLRDERRITREALGNVEVWLNSPELESFVPQIEELVRAGEWDELEDGFYRHLNIDMACQRMNSLCYV